MFVFHWVFYFAVFGTVTSSIYCVLVLLAARRFRRLRLQEESADAAYTPPVSVLKPLHGREEGLEENLEGFFQQNYPNYEILFCARRQDDEGLMLARSIAQRYPHIPVRFLACGEPKFPNPKMYSLAQMAESANNDLLVTSDADARIRPDYLLRCVQPLADPKLSLASCLYIGTPLGTSWSTRLDALGKSVEMSSGVLVADMLSGTDFALGVTMILRRDAFMQAGGYEELGQYWAEDFVLGNRLAEQKRGVRMSTHVIHLTVPQVSFAKSFTDQLRWMQSTRRSRPWGHLGTGLTFALPFGLIGLFAGVLCGNPVGGFVLLMLAVANRLVQAAVVLRALGVKHWMQESWLNPLRDLTGSLLWACSYLPLRSHYHGGHFTITPDGRLERAIEHEGGSAAA